MSGDQAGRARGWMQRQRQRQHSVDRPQDAVDAAVDASLARNTPVTEPAAGSSGQGGATEHMQ